MVNTPHAQALAWQFAGRGEDRIGPARGPGSAGCPGPVQGALNTAGPGLRPGPGSAGSGEGPGLCPGVKAWYRLGRPHTYIQGGM